MKGTSVKVLFTVLLAVLITILALSGTVKAFEGHNNIGLGYGIPYGGGIGLGFEREVEVLDIFSAGPAIGLGHTLDSGLGWAAGIQTHFLSQDDFIRPGISMWYGTNDNDNEGFSVGGDVRMQMGNMLQVFTSTNNYLDIGLQYNTESESLKFGVGYVLRF